VHGTTDILLSPYLLSEDGMKLSIRFKLLGASGLTLALMIALGVIALYQMELMNDRANT
jgi:hypothetical protein